MHGNGKQKRLRPDCNFLYNCETIHRLDFTSNGAIMLQQTLQFSSQGRGFTDITAEIQAVVRAADIDAGLCNVFVRHTSASLIINENADPAVRVDFERYFADLVQDGDPRFTHRDEGDDDMSGHIRSILTQPMVTVPVAAGQLLLGSWQAIYLWEHRTHAILRKVVVTVQ